MSFFDFMSTSQADNSSQVPPYTPINGGPPGASNYNGIGLPADPVSSAPPSGLESSQGADQASPPISNAQSIWDTIKSDSSSAIHWVGTEIAGGASGAKNLIEDGVGGAYSEAKTIVGTVYDDAASAVGTVYNDVSSPVKSILSGTVWYVVLIVGVVAAGLYFVGKGGLAGQVRG